MCYVFVVSDTYKQESIYPHDFLAAGPAFSVQLKEKRIMKFREKSQQITVALLLSAFLSGQAAVLGQTTSESDESTRRKDAAAIRKAEADAALVEAQIAEKNVNTRKTQLDMMKSTTEVTGNVVENSIAASKAIGCAAFDISREVERMRTNDPSINALILHNSNALDLVSQYSALLGEVSSLNGRYDSEVTRLTDKLDRLQGLGSDDIDKEIMMLTNQLLLIESEERNLKNFAVTEKNKLNLTVLSTQKANTTDKLETLKNTKMAIPAVTAISAGIGLALDVFALFKSETAITGSTTIPGSMDLNSYLFRLLTMTIASDGTIINRSRPLSIVSPNHIVLTKADYDRSVLVKSLDSLSATYQRATAQTERAAEMKKAVLNAAKVKFGIDRLQEEVNLASKVVEKAFDALAGDPTNIIFRGKYERALNSKRVAQLGLDSGNKAVEREVLLTFESKIQTELKSVERYNEQAKKMAGRFSDVPENAATPKKLIGDYLKGEILARKIVESNAVWLETNITANGANQRKQSVPIFDSLRGGPVLTFSGGAVVSYQLRRQDATIIMAGTAWAYAPYKRSKNITKFECQGLTGDRLSLTPFKL